MCIFYFVVDIFALIAPIRTRIAAAIPAHRIKVSCPEGVTAPRMAVAAAGECAARAASITPSARPPAMANAHIEWLTTPTAQPTMAESNCPQITFRG